MKPNLGPTPTKCQAVVKISGGVELGLNHKLRPYRHNRNGQAEETTALPL